MPKETWIIAGVLTAALLLGLLGYSSCERKRFAEQAEAELAKAQAGLTAAQQQNAALAQQIADAKNQVTELQKEKDATVQSHKTLEDEMRAALESKDVTISQLQGKLTVNILDRILFDSGEADLKPDGAAVLRKVAGILEQHPKVKIHVIGHTDNVPIRAGARSRFPSNWELSTARATAAVRFLTEKAGVDPARLGAVGYGEFRPVADNSTVEGRAKNRRIAITILSDEIVGADVAPKTQASNLPPNTATNLSPGVPLSAPASAEAPPNP